MVSKTLEFPGNLMLKPRGSQLGRVCPVGGGARVGKRACPVGGGTSWVSREARMC